MKTNKYISHIFKLSLFVIILSILTFGQNNFDESKKDNDTQKAVDVIEKATTKLGGKNYLNVKNSVSEGRFSLMKEGRIASFSSFVDVMIFPNKERTDFDENGSKTVQVNVGDNGWFYDESVEKFADQNEIQMNNFKTSLRSHYNYLLRGDWKGNAELSYVGRRNASIGKSNDVVKLTFEDDFEVELEFSDEGLPMKTIYTTMNSENLPIKHETRFAQYINEKGILTPYVVDRFTDDEHSYRINYQSMEYNKRVSDEIFAKPSDPKKLRKKLKLE